MRPIAPGLSISWMAAMLACSRVPGPSSIQADPSQVAKTTLSPSDGSPSPPKASISEPSAPSLVLPFRLATATEADADLSHVHVDGPSFSEVDQLTTKRRPANSWDIQMIAPTTAAVEKGDGMVGTFFARAVRSTRASGEVETEFVFERGSEPWTKSIEHKITVGPEWRKFEIKFAAEDSYEAGQARALFRGGYDPQIMQIAQFSLANYGKSKAVDALPVASGKYPGQEPDAPWRKAAAERIEKLRKGELTIQVVDDTGNPVSKAKVAVHQRRHAFGFGTAVAASRLLDAGPDGQKYRETIKRLYNRVVFENDLKWNRWDNLGNRKSTLLALKWLRDNKIAVRGHNLVWPSWGHTPPALQALKGDKIALERKIEDHIQEEVGALKGQIDEWDVVNEPFGNHDLIDVLGKDVLVEWFKAARRADPGAKLFLNDYDLLTREGNDSPHQNGTEEVVKLLIQRGAPIDGIGDQCHFITDFTAPARVLQILDRFYALGKLLEITEHDIDIADNALQADYTRDFLTVVFSHPGVIGFLSWGFWEGQHWKPNGAYFRKDWSIKPAGQALSHLIKEQWWTDTSGEVDQRGVLVTRGFLGDYEVVVEAQGKSSTVLATLTAKGTTVRAVLK
jgi:endo-1,4-beta-xylanase